MRLAARAPRLRAPVTSTLGLMTIAVPLIEASITLLPALGGPRVLTGRQYRPHIVIGSASQRAAVVSKDNHLAEKYLGVCFWSGAEKIEPGETSTLNLALIYYPGSEDFYAEVLPGAAFTVREGGKVVGYGTVLRREEWTE